MKIRTTDNWILENGYTKIYSYKLTNEPSAQVSKISNLKSINLKYSVIIITGTRLDKAKSIFRGFSKTVVAE